MTKRSLSLAALVALCSLPAVGRAEMIDNPAYKSWSKFGPGTTSVLKSVTTMATMTVNVEIKQSLVSVDADKCVVEITTKTSGPMGGAAPTVQKVDVKKQVDTKDPNVPDMKALDAATAAEVTVPAGTFSAKMVEKTVTQGPMTMKMKMWFSDEVPGGMVKTEGTGSGQMEMKTTIELASVVKK